MDLETPPLPTTSFEIRGLFDLSGKTALVTGAGQGIGRALAIALAGAGAAVMCADIDPQRVASTKANLLQCGWRAEAVQGDVAKDDEVARLVAATEEAFGGLDILFNNAGISHSALPAHELPLDEWQRVIDVNLSSVFLGARHAAPAMMRRGGGKIVNTASMWGLFGSRSMPLAAYAAAKGGVVNLTRQLALDYGASRINVNAIAPGFVNTGFTRPDRVPQRIADTPLGRYGQPNDLMGAAIFLAAPASDFITGHTLVVDGGYTLY